SGKGNVQDCLQPGYKQVAAGYIIYGSSTIFVYSTGHGVHGFTLDPSVGEFLLSHENIRIPIKGKIYSLNEGNFCNWDEGMQRYIRYLKEQDKSTNRPYSLRYIGTMVGDAHRTLLYGGIFAYPGDKKNPQGKLRLMYECNPMAFIIEQAGGRSSDGARSILQVQPTSLHQHTPVFLGSEEDVQQCEEFLGGKGWGPSRCNESAVFCPPHCRSACSTRRQPAHRSFVRASYIPRRPVAGYRLVSLPRPVWVPLDRNGGRS